MTTLSLIDTGSMHYKARRAGRPVDYAKLFHKLPSGDKIAFGTNFRDSATPFVHRLELLGYQVYFKPVILLEDKPITTTCDVEITMAAIQHDGPVVLVSSNYMMVPLAEMLHAKIKLIGFEASKIFRGLDATDLTEEDLI